MTQSKDFDLIDIQSIIPRILVDVRYGGIWINIPSRTVH